MNDLFLTAARVESVLQELNKYDELPKVMYDDAGAREMYINAANGILPCRKTDNPEAVTDCDIVFRIFQNASSRLARAAALNVYKKARAAVFDESIDEKIREELWCLTEKIKSERRDFGEPHDVVGSSDNPNWWIYAYDNGPMVREVKIKSKKRGMKPFEIVQFSDTHFNYCNERDFREANPALMSTFEYRKWHANGDSVLPVGRAFDFAAMSDQTIVTGDILDYLSYGAQELTQKELFWRDCNMLACIGGHDVTREMQGVVEDTSSEDSRFEILRSFWCNDIFYESKVLGIRALAVVMDNGSSWQKHYTELQYNRLKSDIEYARENDLIVLIFQHEQMCTSNPAEKEIAYVRPYDTSGSRNFFEEFIGGIHTSDEFTLKTYNLIRQSADVIKGVFCGHYHCDLYTELLAVDQNGEPNGEIIPQYVLTATVYENLGHVMKITID